MTLSVECRGLPLSPPRACYRHSEAEGLQGTIAAFQFFLISPGRRFSTVESVE